MHDTLYPEELLAKHRCRIDPKKLITAPISEWDSIKSRARHIEVLRVQIAQVEESIRQCGDIEAVWGMRDNIKRLREIAKTLFSTIHPYVVR